MKRILLIAIALMCVCAKAAATYAIYEEAEVLTEGYYVMYADGKVAKPVGETETFGFLAVEDATVANRQITTDKANGFQLVSADGGWRIKDSFGRYMYLTDVYYTFSVSDGILPAVDEDCYLWTVEYADGVFVITNVGFAKTIQYFALYGSFGAYADARGSYPKLYKYLKDDGDVPPTPEKTTVESLSQLPGMTNNEEFKMDCSLKVVYAKGSYNYVYDGANYGLIYKSGLGLESGYTLRPGWEGKISIFNRLIEMVPDGSVESEIGSAAPLPTEVQSWDAGKVLTAANQNAYVKLYGVRFATATPDEYAGKAEDGTDLRSFTGQFGDTEVAFYQRFGVPSVPAGKYDVTGFITVYNDLVQVLPIGYEVSSGIDGVKADGGPVRYYDMQGIEVANPRQGGIYISVQDGTAKKVKFQ